MLQSQVAIIRLQIIIRILRSSPRSSHRIGNLMTANSHDLFCKSPFFLIKFKWEGRKYKLFGFQPQPTQIVSSQ